MSTRSAKFSPSKIAAACGKLLLLAYPFAVFALLALTDDARERRIFCGIALCAILAFGIFGLLKSSRERRAVKLFAPAAAAILLAAVCISGNEEFFKIYPILVSAGMLAIFAHSLLFPPCIVERIARLTDKDFSDAAIPYVRKVTRVWCAFFIFNIFAAGISCFFPWEIWCIYNGLISYALMGAIFAGEFFVRRRVKKKLFAGKMRKPASLSEIFSENFSRGNPVAFLRGNDEKISFADFKNEVARVAELLKNRPEKNCAIACDDALLFSVALFGALHAGKQILLPQSLRAEMLAAIGEFSPVFLSDKKLDGNAILLKFPPAEKCSRDEKISAELPGISRDSKIVFFSSGSTGTPKRIEKTWANIEGEIISLDAFLPAFPHVAQTTVFASVKCGHLYGLLYACVLPLLRGYTVSTEMIALPADLAARARECESVFFVSSPAFLSRWTQEEEILKNALRNAENSLILSSASPLSRETSLKIFAATKIAPLEIYGTTETGGIASRKQTETSLWTCRAGVKISVRSDGDSENVLFAKTPYDNSVEAISTGDAAEIFPDGKTFRLLGRTNRIVKFQDNRISLAELEQTLAKSPLVKEAFFSLGENLNARKTLDALVALSDEGKNFVLNNGVPALSAELKKFMRSRVEIFAVPKKWRYVGEIPRNAQSKILAREIRERFETKLHEPLVENAEIAENFAAADLIFLPEAPYFQGHFPAFPLLAGVVQLHFAELYARRFLDANVAGTDLSRIKFKSPIFPAQRIRLVLKKSPTRLAFSFSRDGNECSSGNFELKNDSEK